MEQRKVFMMYCIQMYNTRRHHQAHQHQHHHHDQMVSESEVLCQSDDDQQIINQQYQQSRYILPDGKRFLYADDVVQGDFLSCKYDAAFPGKSVFPYCRQVFGLTGTESS